MKSVEQALNTPASEPIRAESSPATTMPRRPGGSRYCDHQREGGLGLCRIGFSVGTDDVLQARHLAAAGQGEADQARNEEQVDGKELEEGGEDAAAAGDLLVGSAQGPLHDVLVGAPVPQADHRAQIAMPSQGKLPLKYQAHADLAFSFTGCPGPFHAGGNQRLPEVEHVGAANAAELAPAAAAWCRPVDGQHGRAGDEDDVCTASL